MSTTDGDEGVGLGVRGGGGVWTRLGLVLALGGVGVAACGQVGLALRVPEAGTWVVGDAIPLHWRFSNQSTQALGFMWEGCCRLNGRLEVMRVGRATPLDTAPAGQALAHMFAKADRLDPGVAKEYDTRVADWVRLPGTGRYRLTGTYRGVLPSQVPQVPRGLGLWRDAATSAPIELEVLGVADYLAQREARVQRRGVRLTLEGPARWSPLTGARYALVWENLGPGPVTVRWPDDVSFWVVDSGGERLAPMAVISGATTNWLLAAGGTGTIPFDFAADRLEGEKTGDYRVFVDLAEGQAGEPRVPSNVVPLAWRFGTEEVLGLLRDAARGAGTGARNASLKMLRVYLGEIGPELERVRSAGLTGDERKLADRLLVASRVRALSPRPGEVGVALGWNEAGGVSWSAPELRSGLAQVPGGIPGQVGELLAIRRHLGWDLGLVLEPSASTTLEDMVGMAGALMTDPGSWAGPAEVRMATGGTNAPVRWRLRVEAEAPVGGVAEGLRGGGGVHRTTEDLRVYVRRGVVWGRVRGVLAGLGAPGERGELVVVP